MDNDREEILSFSDLLFSSDDENQNSIISSSPSFFNQDFSGFFSQEWITPVSPNNDITFCGKLIHTNTQIPNPINKTDSTNINNSSSSSSLSRRDSYSFCKYSNGHSSSFDSVSNLIAVSGRKKHDCYKNDVLAGRTSKPTCSSKSRWHVFMFGSGRFPANMELSDLRSRQLRQIPSMEKGGGKRLTRLIRILGCGGGFDFDDTIRVSSLGYVRSFDRRM